MRSLFILHFLFFSVLSHAAENANKIDPTKSACYEKKLSALITSLDGKSHAFAQDLRGQFTKKSWDILPLEKIEIQRFGIHVRNGIRGIVRKENYFIEQKSASRLKDSQNACSEILNAALIGVYLDHHGKNPIGIPNLRTSCVVNALLSENQVNASALRSLLHTVYGHQYGSGKYEDYLNAMPEKTRTAFFHRTNQRLETIKELCGKQDNQTLHARLSQLFSDLHRSGDIVTGNEDVCLYESFRQSFIFYRDNAATIDREGIRSESDIIKQACKEIPLRVKDRPVIKNLVEEDSVL